MSSPTSTSHELPLSVYLAPPIPVVSGLYLDQRPLTSTQRPLLDITRIRIVNDYSLQNEVAGRVSHLAHLLRF